jgi:hypothetical protein
MDQSGRAPGDGAVNQWFGEQQRPPAAASGAAEAAA